MGRKKRVVSREILADVKFNDISVSKFINCFMIDGKRGTAEKMFYGAMDILTEKAGEEGIKIFRKALENVKPVLEVKSRRVGGATYQVPIEVRPLRRQSLASRWLIDAARSRSEHSLDQKLAGEFLDASQGRGSAMKKKDDVHRMAEANKAFAHFRW